MLKLVYGLHRRPDLTRAQFQDYWRNVHGPLVSARAAVLGITRYVQNHSVDDLRYDAVRHMRGISTDYDGVAEIWFEPEQFFSASSNPTAAQAARDLFEDEQRFI